MCPQPSPEQRADQPPPVTPSTIRAMRIMAAITERAALNRELRKLNERIHP